MAVRLSTGLVNALAGGGAGDGSFKDLFANAVIGCYTGTQPTNADAAETGVLLGYITLASGEFTPGTSTNGLNFDAASNGILAKPTADEWSITPIAAGTIGYCRLYDNARTLGASSSAVRMDMNCGVGTGDIRWSNTSFLVGVKNTLDSLNVTFPKNA